jgi:transcriptional regulator with XRE-family HTH domain
MAVNYKTEPTFGDLIRALRKAKNLGLVDVANASGLDPGLLSRIETGKRNPPDLPVLTRLAEELEVSEDSETFAELVSAATRERAGYPDDADNHLAILHASLNPPGKESTGPPETYMTFCSTFAELVSKAIEQAIISDADQITVKSSSGEVQIFWLLTSTKTKNKKRSRDGR